MKEAGIIMSGDHPKLILDKLKTMTRRTAGLKKINEKPDDWNVFHCVDHGRSPFWRFVGKEKSNAPPIIDIKCPYGGVGDRLWVRATWSKNPQGQMLFKYQYNTLVKMLDLPNIPILWKPSIHLLKEDAEIWLEITEVRAERVQEISGVDCVAEGIKQMEGMPAGEYERQNFAFLWDSLNAKRGYGWAVNPWVWVVSFKVV